MAAPTVRAAATRSSDDSNRTTLILPKPTGTVSGDVLVAAAAFAQLADAATITYPTGWAELLRHGVSMSGYQTQLVWAWKLAGGSEGSSYTFTASANAYPTGFIAALIGAGTPEAYAEANAAATTNLIVNPSVTCGGADRLVLYHSVCNANWGTLTGHTPPSGFTELGDDLNASIGSGARRSFGHKVFGSGATGTFDTTLPVSPPDEKSGATIAVPPMAVAAPVADFTGTPLTGDHPLSVAFADASSNTPTSWAWDFGDGGTSTSQNPTHNYTAAGTYDVELVATNAGGSDTETKTGYVTVSNPAGTFTKIKFGDGLEVTDEGGGVIRVDVV